MTRLGAYVRLAVLVVIVAFLAALVVSTAAAQERRAQWIVPVADASHADSLRAGVAALGGWSDRPDATYYRIHGPLRALRDSLFVYADSNRAAPAGRRVAVSGPWKRWVRFVELDEVIALPPDSTTTDAAPPQDAAFWHQVLHGSALACEGLGACGQGTAGAAGDTGIDAAHPEFAGKFWYGKGYGATSLGPPPDTTNFRDDLPGCNSHGTHVTSTEVGATVGMATKARAVHYRVFSSTGGCLAYTSSVVMALNDATKMGVDAYNSSIGLSQSYSLGVATTNARNLGVAVCGANGNNGGTPLYWPAGAPDGIGTAAVDGSGSRAGFSNYGPETDFGTAGVGVWGALAGGGYGGKSGTSMGSPGTCGLFLQLFSTPEFAAMPRTRARVDSAQTLLCLSAERKPAGGRDDYTGCGTPHVARAIALMRGGLVVAAPMRDSVTTAAPVTVCKPVVSLWPSWKATTPTPWITLTSTATEICYTTVPALMPATGGNAVITIERGE